MSYETRCRMSQIRIGKKLSNETKKKLSESLKGRKHSYSETMNNWISQLRYKYIVYQHQHVIYIGFSKKFLYKFCKESLNISKPIVNRLIDGNYTPVFKKHQHIGDVKISRVNIEESDKNILRLKSVSINPDECKDVDWRLEPVEVHDFLKYSKNMIRR